MEVITNRISVSTRGNSEVCDITEDVAGVLTGTGLREGLVTVFVTGSTASITTTEFEPGLRKDIPDALERIAPHGTRYHHDDTWHDGNGFSHVRAAIMGPSLSIPFSQGVMVLGTWQQIVLVDHDNRPREREIVVQVMGS
jgi:secondary thiamine-phosphate synthase enzyme